MTQFEDVLETILEEYARRDSEGEFDTWEETDAFVKEKAEVLLAYVKEELVSKVWHYQKTEPVNEIADKSRPIIVVYGNNSPNAADKFRYYEDNSDAIWLSNSYEKWAFVEDLINLTHSI